MFKFEGKKEVLSDLGFKPDMTIGGLCKARLISVEVVEAETKKIKEDGSESTWEYAGYTIPSLIFTFHQEKANPTQRDRVLRHIEGVITFKDGSGMDIDLEKLAPVFEGMNSRIVHIHDAFKGDPNYKELPDLTFDEKGGTEKRVAEWKKFFTAIAEAFNNGKNSKPIFVDGKGTSLPLFVKILADKDTGSYYTLPGYVGKGFIERNKQLPPSIELSPSEKDKLALVPRKGKKADKTASAAAGTYETTEEISDDIKSLIEEE